MYKNYKKHGYKHTDKIILDEFRERCRLEIERSKESYMLDTGQDLANPQVGQKKYWKLVNRILNKCKAPKIPPILFANKFVMNAKEKATIFAEFFAKQCRPIATNSVLPPFTRLTQGKLEGITVSSK